MQGLGAQLMKMAFYDTGNLYASDLGGLQKQLIM